MRTKVTIAALAFAGVMTALTVPRSDHPVLLELPFRGFGFVVIGIGWLAWRHEHWARFGPLIVGAGAVYYLQDLRAFTPTFAVGFCLAYLWTAVVVHILLSWPDRAPPVLIAFCYVSAVGSQVLRYAVDRPRPPLTISSPYDHTWAAKLGSVLVTVLMLVVVVVVVRRWLKADKLRRDLHTPVWAAMVVAAIIATTASISSLLEVELETEHTLLVAALSIALLLVPAAVFGAAARILRVRTKLTSLVVDRELDLQSDPDLLRRELAGVLGDPSIRLAYPDDNGSYVDVHGRPFEPRRAVTEVKRGGEVIALLEHDEDLTEAVVDTAGAVVGVAIEGARRYAVLRASRLRIATAAFAERHRIQRDLHDGAQQRLFAVLLLLDLAQDDPQLVRRAHTELKGAIGELRELIQGIYPAALIEHGLAVAVDGLADVAPIPLSYQVPRTRWPREVEAAAYFTIAEVLANAYKHAQATHVRVDVEATNNVLHIDIADDGVGGAKPRGLHDRVATVGGTLRIDSPPGEGTRITATIPLEQS